MPYMYSEMQNKLSKIRESPLESMGQIISSRCPSDIFQLLNSKLSILLHYLCFRRYAAGVVPCGIPKERLRTSSIVHLIFYFLVL